MSSFGSFYPVLNDVNGVIAATCQNVAAQIRPDAPEYVLSVSNPSTSLWEDENGGLIQEEDGSGIILA